MEFFVGCSSGLTLIKQNKSIFDLTSVVNFETSKKLNEYVKSADLNDCLFGHSNYYFCQRNQSYIIDNAYLPILFNSKFVLFIGGRLTNNSIVIEFLINFDTIYGPNFVKSINNQLQKYTKLYDKQIRLRYLPVILKCFDIKSKLIDDRLNNVVYLK